MLSLLAQSLYFECEHEDTIFHNGSNMTIKQALQLVSAPSLHHQSTWTHVYSNSFHMILSRHFGFPLQHHKHQRGWGLCGFGVLLVVVDSKLRRVTISLGMSSVLDCDSGANSRVVHRVTLWVTLLFSATWVWGWGRSITSLTSILIYQSLMVSVGEGPAELHHLLISAYFAHRDLFYSVISRNDSNHRGTLTSPLV